MNFQQLNRPASAPVSNPVRDASSLTYEPYYGLKEKPFSLLADPRFVYRSHVHGSAFDDLLAAIRRREGLIVVTGDIGVGKTTLCRSALEHLDRKTFSAFVPDPFMSREDLLKTLLIDFGVVSIDELRSGRLAASSRLELSYVLYEFLESLVPLQAVAVAVIDEAQNLSVPLLEEIRILSELVGREKLLQVVLVGQLELETHLKLPQMRQLDQRVAMRHRLEPLSPDEVSRYIAHRLHIASGGAASVSFTGNAMRAVCDLTGGVPRVVNLLCDRALHESWVETTDHVQAVHVLRAARRLGIFAQSQVSQTTSTTSEAIEPVSTNASPVNADLPPSPSTWTPANFLSEEEIATSRERATRLRRFARAAALVFAVVALGLTVAAWSRITHPLEGDALQFPPTPPAPVRRLGSMGSESPAREGRYVALLPISQIEIHGGDDDGQVSYGIQIASFVRAGLAAQVVDQLRAEGINARAVERDLGDRGRWHQVLADGYASLEAAEADLTRIRQMPAYSDARLMRYPSSN